MWIEVKTSSRAMRSLIRIEFLEIVAVPRHEGAEHVAPECELAKFGRGAVGDDVAFRDAIAHLHQRALVDAGGLVGAHELAEPIDIDAAGRALLGGRAHDDARAVDLIDHAGAAGDDRGSGIARHRRLHAGADERGVGLDQRHRLALHVRAHQRAVGVVVLEEGDQRRGDRDELLGRDVDRRHLLGQHEAEIAAAAHRDQFLGEAALRVERGIGLGDDELVLVHRREVLPPLLHLAVLDQPVRRLDEAVFVDGRVGRERVDEADVRPLGGFDRANAPVMRGVHVAHLEARALAGEPARAERGEPALVGDLGERVGLVHELRELRGAEELAHRRRRRLGVDQVVRHHGVDIDAAHALADRPLHAQQPDAVLVLHQLADRAHAAIAEIVDVVDAAAAVLEVAERLDGAQDVDLTQHADRIVGLELEPLVHLDPADGREVVAVGIEEEAAEEGLGGLRCRRLARPHQPVDVDQRVLAVGVLVDRQRVADPGAVRLVDGERGQPLEAGFLDGGELGLGQLLAGLGVDLPGLEVDEVLGDEAAEEVGAADQHLLGLLGDPPRRPLGELRLRLGDDLAGLGVDQGLEQLDAAEGVGIEGARPALGERGEDHAAVEVAEDLLGIHAADLGEIERLALGGALLAERRGPRAVERVEERGHRQLALTVDPHIEQVLGVELEIEPGAAIGDDAGGEEVFAGRVRLALVVIEEHTGAAVHLAHDHALGAVDDEGAVVRHQRHIAHVDGLFLDVADRAGAGVLIDVPDDQAEDHLERRGIGHAPLDALLDVVFGLLELVIDELEPAAAGKIVDRENGLEDFLQPGMEAGIGGDMHLQERLVGGALDVDQVRHRRHLGNAPEAAADTLLAGERLKDRAHSLSCCPKKPMQKPLPRCSGARRGATGCANSQRGGNRTDSRPAFPKRPKGAPAIRIGELLDLDSGALLFQHLPDLLRLFLAHSLLHRLRSPFDQVLGLLEPKPRDRADLLDDVDLLFAELGQHDGELGLLLDRRGGRGRSARRGGNRDRCGGRDAPLLFQELRELRGLQNRQAGELVSQLRQVCHVCVSC